VHSVRKKRNNKSATHVTSEDGDADFNAADGAAFDAANFDQRPGLDATGAEQAVYPAFIPQPNAPEVDEHGNVNWRTAWLNELAKLQHITAEQDKLQAEPEWYREMLFRVRTAMMATIDANGVLQVASAPHVPAVPVPNPDEAPQ